MEFDFTSRRVIRELCIDSRIPVSRIAEKVGRSRSTIAARIPFVEENAGLCYTVEPNLDAIGLSYSYFVAVKLRRDIPEENLASLLSSSAIPQFAAFCRGEFDLLLFVSARNHLEYMRWSYQFRSALSEEIVSWKASHLVFARHGFFPINERTISESTIPSPQKELLAELNRNSRLTFRELAKKLKMSVPRVRYYYRLLVKSGMIKRFTAVMQTPSKPVHLVHFRHYTYQADHEAVSKRDRVLIKTESEFQVPNTYSFVVETSGASDGFDWTSAETINEAYAGLRAAEQLYGGFLKTECATVTKVVYGLWPIRSMDLDECYDESSWDEARDGKSKDKLKTAHAENRD